MTCYSPLQGYRARYANKSGKRSIVFNPDKGFIDMPVEIPCGQCHGCRLDKSRQWAIRCVHEASIHEKNIFITLTYNNKNLPENQSVSKREWQLFMKKLRKKFPRATNNPIRYYMCGEYGDLKNRPHYHAILFNMDLKDKKLWSKDNGNLLYRSETLEKIWNKGYCIIGDVTFESAAYVARYCMKKYTGENADKEYELLDKDTGQIHKLESEFALMSRGGKHGKGIGHDWYKKYKGDTEKGFITVNKMKVSIPKYYDSMLEAEDKLAYEELKDKRRKIAHSKREDNTPARLRQKERVQTAKTKLLIRNIEAIK